MKATGFTLIEFLLVLFILSIMLLFTNSIYSVINSHQELKNAEINTLQAIKDARFFSKTSYEDSAWGVFFQEHQIIVFKGTSFSGRDLLFDYSYENSEIISFSGINEIIFEKESGFPNQTGDILIIDKEDNKSVCLSLNKAGILDYE